MPSPMEVAAAWRVVALSADRVRSANAIEKFEDSTDYLATLLRIMVPAILQAAEDVRGIEAVQCQKP